MVNAIYETDILEQYPIEWNHWIGRFAFLNKVLER